jgi:hypothetical protein
MTHIGYAKPEMFQHLLGPTLANLTTTRAIANHSLLGFSRLQGLYERDHRAGNPETPWISSLSAPQSQQRDRQDSSLTAPHSQVFSTSQQVNKTLHHDSRVYSTPQALLGLRPSEYNIETIATVFRTRLHLRCFRPFMVSFRISDGIPAYLSPQRTTHTYDLTETQPLVLY